MGMLLSGDLGRGTETGQEPSSISRDAADSGMQDSAEHHPGNGQGEEKHQASYGLSSQVERCWSILAGLRPSHTLEIR